MCHQPLYCKQQKNTTTHKTIQFHQLKRLPRRNTKRAEGQDGAEEEKANPVRKKHQNK